MIDHTKAKADAEEGLRIARRATEAPWDVEHDIVRAVGRYSIGGFDETDDSLFAADSRTRAPDAYRNVIALAEENERLSAEVARWGKLELDHLRIDSLRLGDLIAMQEKVTALEAEVARLSSENEKHLEQLWAFETEVEQLRAQLDKYADVKPAKGIQ